MIVSGIKFVAGRNDYTDRDGTKYGIAIHNTSNDASAAGEASYATRRTDGVSAHFYVDDREVIQSIDTKYRTGHAGSTNGNENAVSVEITGTNAKSRAWWIANVAWDELGRVLAAVCRTYNIEPRRASVAEMKSNPRVRAFYSHDDMRRAWGGTTHTDPGPNFPWDHLFTAVKSALTPEDDVSAADVFAYKVHNDVTDTDVPFATYVRSYNNSLTRVETGLRELYAAVKGIDTDEQAIASAILATLTPQAIAAALPAELVSAMADELAARMAE